MRYFLPRGVAYSIGIVGAELASYVTLAGQAALLGLLATVVISALSAIILGASCVTTLLVQWYVGPIQPAYSTVPLHWSFDAPVHWPRPRTQLDFQQLGLTFVNVANAQMCLELHMLATSVPSHMVTAYFKALNRTGGTLLLRQNSFPSPAASWLFHPILPSWAQSRHITVPFGTAPAQVLRDSTAFSFELSTTDGVLIVDSSLSMERTMHGLAYYLQSNYTYLPTMVLLTTMFYCAMWMMLIGCGVPVMFYLVWGS